MSEKNKPEAKYVFGSVSATVWKNKVTKGDQEFDVHSVTIQRSYKDKDDNWQTTSSMRVEDLPKLAIACGKAYEALTKKDV